VGCVLPSVHSSPQQRNEGEIMAVPTKAQQVDAIEALLGADDSEGQTLKQLATTIVDGYHQLLSAGLKASTPPLHEGVAFKSPLSGKVHHVAWSDGNRVWLVASGTRYGWFGSVDDPLWAYTEPTNAKAGAPGANPDWNVGDVLTLSQRRERFRVVATHDKCVLMQNVETGVIQADSNDNLAKYYRKAS